MATNINPNARGRKKKFFLFGVKEEIVRVNVPIDKIGALREQEMNEGVEADAKTFTRTISPFTPKRKNSFFLPLAFEFMFVSIQSTFNQSINIFICSGANV